MRHFSSTFPVRITLPSNTHPDSLSSDRYISITCLLRSYYLPITKKYFFFALTFRKTIQLILFHNFTPPSFPSFDAQIYAVENYTVIPIFFIRKQAFIFRATPSRS
ncbi:hypothetical protein Barb6_00473 [Bacteroidales bacterium Barb6]|nr:hypothetical protein Barb6_00473 [Bacteroidales bacterium Barb6]